MAESKKRKAVTRDIDQDAAIISGDEFEFDQLDGAISDAESASDNDVTNGNDLESD